VAVGVIGEMLVGDWLPVFFIRLKGDGLGVMPSTMVARRRLGWGAVSSGVAGAGRTSGPFGTNLRAGNPVAGADVERAERFGVDFELADEAANPGAGVGTANEADFGGSLFGTLRLAFSFSAFSAA
jgi:hypothetical protein